MIAAALEKSVPFRNSAEEHPMRKQETPDYG
jgi:hypothetical protein